MCGSAIGYVRSASHWSTLDPSEMTVVTGGSKVFGSALANMTPTSMMGMTGESYVKPSNPSAIHPQAVVGMPQLQSVGCTSSMWEAW